VHRIDRQKARQTTRWERNGGQRVVVWRGGQDHIAIGKIAEPRGTPSTIGHEIRDPLRISVIDQHLVSVLFEVRCKCVAHLAQTDDTNTPAGERS